MFIWLQLLSLDAAQARELVLRQPLLLVSSTEELHHKTEVLSELIGHEHLAKVTGGLPAASLSQLGTLFEQ